MIARILIRQRSRPPAALLSLFAVLCLALTGCASAPQQGAPTADAIDILEHIGTTTPTRVAIVRAAAAMLDKPYRSGATGPTAFSDNGLVAHAYGQAGVHLPLAPHGLLGAGAAITLQQAQPGDLVFYQTRAAGGADSLRVGLYLNSAEMLYASARRQRVVIANIDDPYWTQRLLGVVQVLP